MTPSGKIGQEGSDDSSLQGPERATEAAQGGGSSALHVFEVTDLFIPSGTDWTTTPHVFGTLELQPWNMVFVTAYFEVGENTGTEGISLKIAPAADIGFTPGTFDNLYNSSASAIWPDPFSMAHVADLTDPNPTVTVAISTADDNNDGATYADITIVRARVALLVI